MGIACMLTMDQQSLLCALRHSTCRTCCDAQQLLASCSSVDHHDRQPCKWWHSSDLPHRQQQRHTAAVYAEFVYLLNPAQIDKEASPI